MKQNKFFNGSVEEFSEWLIALKIAAETDEVKAKQYSEIEKSVIYISENFEKDIEDSIENRFEGAIYAHGAIIESSSLEWDDMDTSVGEWPEEEVEEITE